MLTLLARLSIGSRLTLGFGILVALTVLVSAVFFTVSGARDAAQAEADSTRQVTQLADQIVADLLQARYLEEAFLLGWRREGFQSAYDRYIVPNRERIQAIRDHLAELRSLVADQDSLDSLDGIEQATHDYDSLLTQVVNDIQRRGSVTTGLEGDLQRAANALELSSSFAANPRLQVTLMQMRRSEKDYLLRGVNDSVNATYAFNTQLQEQIRLLDIPDDTKNRLLTNAADYLSRFDELVNLERDITASTAALRTTAESVDPLVEQIRGVTRARQAEADAKSASAQSVAASLNTLAMFVAIIVGLALAVIIRRSIVRPVARVAAVTEAIAAGDLTQRVSITTGDEIGKMSQTINAMADQLQDFIGTLEARVSARTRDFQVVADVNQQISTILDVNRLLQDVADLTKERFRLYHAHIYLLDEASNALLLSAGAGHVGRQMVSEVRAIALDNQQSIVARAAYTRKPVVVNDVDSSAVFLPHPLLPDTRSELAVPLVARGQLIGVLDVQADQVDFFSADSVQVFELMAGQVAAALSNASLYEAAERTSRHERALGNIDRRIQGALDVDEVLQVTVRELGKALRVPHTAIELQLDAQSAETN